MLKNIIVEPQPKFSDKLSISATFFVSFFTNKSFLSTSDFPTFLLTFPLNYLELTEIILIFAHESND